MDNTLLAQQFRDLKLAQMQPYQYEGGKLAREMTHQATTPIQQFQQEFPQAAQYGQDVASGRVATGESPYSFGGGLNRLAQTLQQASDDPTALLEYVGPGQIGGLVGTTVVKSARGEPVRRINEIRAEKDPNIQQVYHSTDVDFSKFDPEKGIGGQMWFTSKKDLAEKGYEGAQGGRLVTADVDIRNPAGWDEYDKYSLDELMAQGYDGLKLSEEGEDVYVAFFPEQVTVKSNIPVK